MRGCFTGATRSYRGPRVASGWASHGQQLQCADGQAATGALPAPLWPGRRSVSACRCCAPKVHRLAVEIGSNKPGEALVEGFLRIAVENMGNAINQISVQRGYDVTQDTMNCLSGDGIARRMRFPEPMTVTVQSSHRVCAPLGCEGGGPGTFGRKAVQRFDWSLGLLGANDRAAHAAGKMFVTETLGGGGGRWGTTKRLCKSSVGGLLDM
ncbi:MAG: hydantoinase B/oxoprolinase family protein [Pseudomonadota bacterium]